MRLERIRKLVILITTSKFRYLSAYAICLTDTAREHNIQWFPKWYNWYHKQDTAVRGMKRGLIYCKYRALRLNQDKVKRRERTPLSVLICTNSRISSSRRPNSRFIQIYPSSFWKISWDLKNHLLSSFFIYFIFQLIHKCTLQFIL